MLKWRDKLCIRSRDVNVYVWGVREGLTEVLREKGEEGSVNEKEENVLDMQLGNSIDHMLKQILG